ncbi:MAG: energy transducer TonB [Sulfurimonas sp.]|jgi:TonB family protein
MRNLYKRAVISIASTTILHASIFYTLNEVKQPQIVTPKAVEIALFDMPKVEKKEESKPKAEEKSIVKEKPIQKPKPSVKEKIVPKPIQKPNPITKEEPDEPKTTVEQMQPLQAQEKPSVEPMKIAKNDSASRIQEPKNEQKATSKVAPNEMESYLFRVREKIEKNLRYPSLAKRLKLEGESIVAFEILDDGSVRGSSLEIKNSSGHKSLDRQAIDTILSVSPFDTPPQNNMSIVLPVAFKLNR